MFDNNEPVFMVLNDVRETQDPNRVATDGKMDHPFLALTASDKTLAVYFCPGTQTPPEASEPYVIYLSREGAETWIAELQDWLDSGYWPTVGDKLVDQD